MNETKLKTKDLVNIGIFSVIYMALSMAVMIIPILSPILWLLWPAMTGIICNFIYMLLVSKVPKPGTALLLIAITGIIYFAIGECTFTIVITCVIAGVLAEITRKILGYKSQKSVIVSSGLICIGLIGSPLPMWLFQESYMKSIIKMGMSPEYVNKLQTLISIPTLIGMIITAFIGGVIGAYIGKAMFKKLFEKAGIM